MELSYTKIFQVIWFILCTLGNIYQVEQMTHNYFEYKITTTTMISYPEKYVMPKISICFQIPQLIDYESMDPKDFSSYLEKMAQVLRYYDSHVKNKISQEFVNLTSQATFSNGVSKLKTGALLYMVEDAFTANQTNQEVFSIILNTKRLFHQCRLLDPVTYSFRSFDCDDNFLIQVFRKEFSICYAFKTKLPLDQTYDYQISNRVLGTSGIQYDIIMNETVSRSLKFAKLFFTDMDELPRFGFTSYFDTQDVRTWFRITYVWYKNELLPDPYDTGCIDYKSSFNLTSRGDCFEQCFRNESLKHLGEYILPGPLIQAPGDDKISVTTFQYLKNDYSNLSVSIQRKCTKVCRRPNCIEYIFIPDIFGQKSYAQAKFQLFIIQTPVISTIYAPKVDMIQFLSDFIGSFGFWLGISVLNIFDLFHEYIVKRLAGNEVKIIKSNSVSQAKIKTNRVNRWERKLRAKYHYMKYLEAIKDLDDSAMDLYMRNSYFIGNI